MSRVCATQWGCEESAGEFHYDESPVREAELATLSERAFGDYYQRQFGIPLEEEKVK
jgi:hypothetical protein